MKENDSEQELTAEKVAKKRAAEAQEGKKEGEIVLNTEQCQ